MQVTIYGPNLADQSKGTFHVHAADCRDPAPYEILGRVRAEGWTIEVPSRWGATLEVYSDHIREAGDAGEAHLRGYLDDLWFAPCCRELPEGSILEAQEVALPGYTERHVVELCPGLPGEPRCQLFAEPGERWCGQHLHQWEALEEELRGLQDHVATLEADLEAAQEHVPLQRIDPLPPVAAVAARQLREVGATLAGVADALDSAGQGRHAESSPRLATPRCDTCGERLLDDPKAEVVRDGQHVLVHAHSCMRPGEEVA